MEVCRAVFNAYDFEFYFSKCLNFFKEGLWTGWCLDSALAGTLSNVIPQGVGWLIWLQ